MLTAAQKRVVAYRREHPEATWQQTGDATGMLRHSAFRSFRDAQERIAFQHGYRFIPKSRAGA